MPITNPEKAINSRPVSLAQAIASIGEHLLTPQWLMFAAAGPSSVQQAIGDKGPVVTITRYEDPASDRWVMVKQFHVGQFRPQGPAPDRFVAVNSASVALFEVTIRGGGRATDVLRAFWTHGVTDKPIEVQSHGISEDDLIRVLESIK